jgi:hypothetical protein
MAAKKKARAWSKERRDRFAATITKRNSRISKQHKEKADEKMRNFETAIHDERKRQRAKKQIFYSFVILYKDGGIQTSYGTMEQHTLLFNKLDKSIVRSLMIV